MDNVKTNFNEAEFIKKLEMLYELEMQKPLKAIDTDFIDDIVSLTIELKGLRTELTPEEVEEKVRKIPFVEIATLNTTPESVKGRATKVKSHKILLIAAIISILVAIFTITSIAFDWNIFDELKNRFGTVADTPVNEEINVGGITVISDGEFYFYDTLDDIEDGMSLDILYPLELPGNIELTQLMLSKDNFKDKVIFVFDNVDFTYSVTFSAKVSDDVKNGVSEVIEINNIKCYFTEISDLNIVQVCFAYNDNLYKLVYNNKQDLIYVIENLKELQ